jgi:hypothetical protein
MAAFTGKYELTNVEGMAALYDEIKAPEEYRAKLRALIPELKANPSIYTEEIAFGGGKFHRKVFVKGELKRDAELTIGAENDVKGQDGRPVKVKVTVESDHKVVIHERGDGFEFTATAELTGTVLVITSKAGSVTSVLSYKKL